MESSDYNVAFINPILQAVENVLSKMAQVEVEPGKPYVNLARTAAGDVTGVIGLTGDLTGVLSVTFEKDVILTITNTMLGENYTELDENIADAVGELTNMITGQARMHLSKDGIHLKAATPSVIMGKGHVISHISPAPILSVPFSTAFGSFVVEISMAHHGPHRTFDPLPEKITLWQRPSKHAPEQENEATPKEKKLDEFDVELLQKRKD